MKSAVFPFALALLTIAPASVLANAETARTSFSVSVMVLPYCAASASPMRFGSNPGNAAGATSTVSVNCNSTTDAPYNVGLSSDLAPGAVVANRIMIGPGSVQLKNLPRAEMRGLVTLGRPVSVETTAPNGFSSQTLSVPGQTPVGKSSVDAAYPDIITVTVTY
ncbi:MAG TPA: spore coat protein U domain-containing protein [Terracidiphilus sp.]|nr:spore coat protein U domain-containing protein [Terracidiphilus sp.]